MVKLFGFAEGLRWFKWLRIKAWNRYGDLKYFPYMRNAVWKCKTVKLLRQYFCSDRTFYFPSEWSNCSSSSGDSFLWLQRAFSASTHCWTWLIPRKYKHHCWLFWIETESHWRGIGVWIFPGSSALQIKTRGFHFTQWRWHFCPPARERFLRFLYNLEKEEESSATWIGSWSPGTKRLFITWWKRVGFILCPCI